MRPVIHNTVLQWQSLRIIRQWFTFTGHSTEFLEDIIHIYTPDVY